MNCFPLIAISAEVVNAAKAGSTAALDEANKKWYANADEISTFLSKANPNWGLADMKMMMNNHLKLTIDEAVQHMNFYLRDLLWLSGSLLIYTQLTIRF